MTLRPLRRYVMLSSLLLLALLAAAQGRAVNISNTWILPEEGFPVFYRYFRDRISWYEADAVCQFHHANLVTVDTTAQYDAVRAYLKELDISSVVWVGLIRSNPDGDFTWTDYRGLSGDGYWSSAPDARAAPLCAAADPAADYRWEARACGGPTVASFICELPVPQWALTSEGCMVRALPALTVLYLPESAAVQLTADCGLAGVKRVQCTGNVNHEDLLRDLSCNEDDDSSLPTSTSSWTTSEIDQGTNDATIEDNITTEHEGDVSTWNDITSSPDLFRHISVGQNKVTIQQQIELGQDNTVLPNKNINLDVSLHNNLQSNDIPKHIVLHNDLHSDDQLEKQEDEKHMQNKLLHNELARLGNIENIFTQPTDHFVPPLVMAKAKANDDMTAISFEEKLAQQHIEHEITKDSNMSTNINSKIILVDSTTVSTTTTLLKSTTNVEKDKHKINKYILPKKYNQTSAEIKSKVEKLPIKLIKSTKPSTISTQTGTSNNDTETTTSKSVVYFDPANEDNLLDLTVIIKEPELIENDTNMNFNMSETSNITNNYGSLSNTRDNKEITTLEIVTSTPYEFNTESDEIQNMTLNDEIIKITFIHDDDHFVSNSTVFEITTKIPIFKDNTEDVVHMSSTHSSKSTILNSPTSASDIVNIEVNNEVVSSPFSKTMTNLTVTDLNKINTHETESSRVTYGKTNTTFSTPETLTEHKKEIDNNGTPSKVIHHLTVKESINDFTESENLDYGEKNDNDTSQYIDDFQSPLLSGANEPLHKPNRSRRPQQQNRIKKFNPFRILG